MKEIIDIIQTALLLVVLYLLVKRAGGVRLPTNKTGRKVILDTCALIDGRILEIANAGFISGQPNPAGAFYKQIKHH